MGKPYSQDLRERVISQTKAIATYYESALTCPAKAHCQYAGDVKRIAAGAVSDLLPA